MSHRVSSLWTSSEELHPDPSRKILDPLHMNSENSEIALAKWHLRYAEQFSENTRKLPQLRVGDQVRIQNQAGSKHLEWDETGTVIDVRQHNQYIIKVDGSGVVTLRNRKFLRSFTPFRATGPPNTKHHTPTVTNDSPNPAP